MDGRQRGHGNCGHAAMPLRAILSLAASAQPAVKWEKLSPGRMPADDPSFSPRPRCPVSGGSWSL